MTAGAWVPPGFAARVREDVAEIAARHADPDVRERAVAAYLGVFPKEWVEAAIGPERAGVVSGALSIPLLAKLVLGRGNDHE